MPHMVPPPPGVADAALEQLAAATHKRPVPTHGVLIPQLLTSHWRCLLGKICDFVFSVPVGTSCWPHTQFEPLIIGIYFPLLSCRAWRLCGPPPFLDSVARNLSGVPWDDHDWGGGAEPRMRPGN